MTTSLRYEAKLKQRREMQYDMPSDFQEKELKQTHLKKKSKAVTDVLGTNI